MARPPAETIISTNVSDFDSIDIMTASGLWAVLYKDQPISFRTRRWTAQGETRKYIKTVFPSPAPAKNLAKKLNAKFITTDFSVKKIL